MHRCRNYNKKNDNNNNNNNNKMATMITITTTIIVFMLLIMLVITIPILIPNRHLGIFKQFIILYIHIYIYIYIYIYICIYRNKIVRKLDDNENSVFKYRFKNRFLIAIHFSHLLLQIKLSLRVLKNLLLYIYIYKIC